MEATGVCSKPVRHVLEGVVELVLANATHVKNVPGRKTDVHDATWLAELLAHGLIRGSFVPPPAIQEDVAGPVPSPDRAPAPPRPLPPLNAQPPAATHVSTLPSDRG
jgi:hypothetical protein